MKERYPFDIFPTLWDKLNMLIESKRLISHQQVYEELKGKDDELLQWAKQHKKMFRELDQEQNALVKKILAKFPRLIDPLKQTAEADPFVIALAIIERRNLTMLGDDCSVVSEEKPSRGNRPKIPDVCNYYDLGHFLSLEFFSNEGWKF